MSLRKCETCGNPKGYPYTTRENRTRPDGSVYSCQDVKWLCWTCRTSEDEERREARAKRDAEEKRKLEEIGARFREAEKQKWGLPK